VLDLLDAFADTWWLVVSGDPSFTRERRLRGTAACKTRKGAHFRDCRLLHGSACLPKRERAPDRDPFDVAV